MKNFLFILFIFSVLFIGVSFSVQVVDLTNDNYDNAIKSHEYSVTMLYAPWCGYCGKFKPILEEAAKNSENVYFGRVDCTVEVKLCQRLRVNYYPTLVFHKYGHSSIFTPEQTAEGLLKQLEGMTGFQGKILKSKEEIESFRQENKYHVIGYFSNFETQAFKNYMIGVEKRILHETPVALVSDTSLFDGRKEGTVDVFNSQSYNPIHLQANTPITYDTVTKLASDMFQNTFPTVVHIDDNNYTRYRQNRRPLFLAWIDLTSPNKDETLKIYEQTAKKFPNFNFGYVDYSEKKERLYKLGAVRSQPNTILRINFLSDDSFIYELPQPFTVDGISKWINGIVSGNVKPNILSELIPETNDGPVFKVVGLNFEEVVMDPTKDVFIQYYIDWCEGCKYLETLDKVGEALRGIDDVLVAKVDYNINDIKEMHLEIYGNPTLAIYLRNNKTNPIVYSGTQSSDDLLSFFKKHTLSERARAVPDLPVEAPPNYDSKFDDAKVVDLDGNDQNVVRHDEL